MSQVIKSVTVLAAGLAIPAYAADLTATKSAPAMDKLIKPVSANVQYRYYYDRKMNKDELLTQPLQHQMRSNITFSLFNDKISSTVIVGAIKGNGDQKLTARRPRIWNQFDIASSGPFSLAGYAYIHMPFKGSGGAANLGLNGNISQDLGMTSAGSFSLSVDAYGDAYFTSRSEDAVITNATEARQRGYTLVDSSGDSSDGANLLEGQKDDPDYGYDVDALISYKPTAFKKWTISTGVNTNAYFTPKYTLNADNTRDTSFERSLATASRLKLNYKASDMVSVTSNTWYWTEGLFNARVNGSYGANGLSRWSSLTSVSYKFF